MGALRIYGDAGAFQDYEMWNLKVISLPGRT